MKRIFKYATIVLSCYFVFVLISFPAERAYEMAKGAMPKVVLYDVKGTLWSGQANAVVIDGKPLREFEWSVSPWRLFMGYLAADMKFDNNTTWANANVALSLGGNVVVSDLLGQLPGSELQSILPKIPARLGGIFQMDLDEIVYSPEAKVLLEAEGRVDWQSASISVMQEAKIGDFQLDLTTTDAGVNGVFTDVNEGPLMVEGNVILSPEKHYKLDAKLKVRDQNRQDLVQSLRFIGQTDVQGLVAFNKEGAL